jgi:hypothetical protein
MRYILRIYQASPSLNEYTYNRNPFIQRADKQRWAWLIRTADGFNDVPKATGPRSLHIERHGRRRLDPDNLIGGAKCVITDNLRALGLLIDDNDSLFAITAENVKLQPKEKPFTVLVLTDTEPNKLR